jgi:DNA-binding transcriptional MerR regulator
MRKTLKSEVKVRPIDLARLAGISTQQVRNYLADGVLPPASRTDAGYRTFTARHSDALLTYRALATGFGWNTAKEIMRAIHASDPGKALALVNASHADLHDQRRTLEVVGDALEAVAAEDTPLPRQDMRIGEVAAHLGVRTSALRVWESAGLLNPRRVKNYRSYGQADVRDARMIKMLRQGRYLLPQIQPILDGLRETGSSDALRAAIAERQAGIARRTMAMIESVGHLHRYLAAGEHMF